MTKTRCDYCDERIIPSYDHQTGKDLYLNHSSCRPKKKTKKETKPVKILECPRCNRKERPEHKDLCWDCEEEKTENMIARV